MYYFKKYNENDEVILYSSIKPPKNKEGLIEITQEEYKEIQKIFEDLDQ